MKAIILSFLLFLSFAQFTPVLCQPTKTAIEDIVKNPTAYSTKSVEIEGYIIQYVHATSPTNTSYYLIKDSYGYIIKVNTAEAAPEINGKYIVTGIAYTEKIFNRKGLVTDSPFISEKDKTIVLPPQPIVKTTTTTKTEITGTPGSEPAIPLWMYLVSSAGIVLIGGLLFVYVRTKNKNKQQTPDWQSQPSEHCPPSGINDEHTP